MRRKFQVGCLVVILYCLGCSLYIGISGRGLVEFMAEMPTLQGGAFTMRDRIIARSMDIVTAPVQIAVAVPLFGISYIRNHTGERGRELAEHERQRAAHARYVKLLDENFDRIYIESEFLNPTNTPAMEALLEWTARWDNRICDGADAACQRRFAEYVLDHRELMLPLREFWRMSKPPVDLQRRALATALEMAEKNPCEDVKWLLWGVMNKSAKEVSPGDEISYTFPDEVLRGYATNRVEIIRWSAQESLKDRSTYREYCCRQKENN